MTGTYSYNPANIREYGKDRLRFELGDTMVECGPETAYLADEEIDAVLADNTSWTIAKLKCLESIMRRFSYEVDTKVGQMDLKLGARFDRIKAMYDEIKKQAENVGANPAASIGRPRPPYFRESLHDNRLPAGNGRRPASCIFGPGIY